MGRGIFLVLIAAVSLGVNSKRRLTVESFSETDQAGILAISGGADVASEDACYMAVQSAEVAVRTVASPSATISLALSSEDREESDWAACFKLNAVEPQRPRLSDRLLPGVGSPWGNGLPPLITIHAGEPKIPQSDPQCTKNWVKLDQDIAKKLSSVSASRAKQRSYDKNRPTLGVRGEDCVTINYFGGADHLPQYNGKAVPGPPRPGMGVAPAQKTPWAGGNPNQSPNQPELPGWGQPAQTQPKPTSPPQIPGNNQPNQGRPWWANGGTTALGVPQPQPPPQQGPAGWGGNDQPGMYQSTITIITITGAPPPGY